MLSVSADCLQAMIVDVVEMKSSDESGWRDRGLGHAVRHRGAFRTIAVIFDQRQVSMPPTAKYVRTYCKHD